MWLSRTTVAPVKARSRLDRLADDGRAQVADVHLLGGVRASCSRRPRSRPGGRPRRPRPGSAAGRWACSQARSSAGLAVKLMKPGPATETSKPAPDVAGRAASERLGDGPGGFPAALAAARTPLAWKSPCRASAVRTPGSKAPGSTPAAGAAALRALSSWPIKSNARCIRPLHHPAAGGRKRGLFGPFWLDIFTEEVWLVRFPGPGTLPLPAHLTP